MVWCDIVWMSFVGGLGRVKSFLKKKETIDLYLLLLRWCGLGGLVF